MTATPEPLDLEPIETRLAELNLVPIREAPRYLGRLAEDVPALLAEVRRLRPAMTAPEAYRDAQRRVAAVAAQHIPRRQTGWGGVVPVDAVEALAGRLGRLAEATEVQAGRVAR